MYIQMITLRNVNLIYETLIGFYNDFPFSWTKDQVPHSTSPVAKLVKSPVENPVL